MQPNTPSPILLSVFPAGPGGGNPCPVVLDACGMDADAMRAVAAAHGHESGFVLPPEDPASADIRFRFFVPEHEMEMCGHATLGAAWLLRAHGRVAGPELRIETLSGLVRAIFGPDGAVEVTQPPGRVEAVEEPGAVLSALGLTTADLAPGASVVNAATSRVKTLVPLAALARLHALAPDPARVRAACEAIGSTGLYPWAAGPDGAVHARQFPRSSGYPEDAATGIAAAALFYGLGAPAGGLRVRQGEAMGRPSEIQVRPDPDGPGCRLGGRVELLS
ncbi:PhzF family phenazine biosynthesis isomerase [Pseudoroseomonas wenyumeiae]|uniref:PhzF family phenazine biosynthesis isomerase n=1 Tax=Teichococcus wenyumeiae TaxID=2478470 RepID=A0A3A9JLC9_9PROT|nr:PhzF family phenazine biosynthesis isomerase [Pseudoroseomonas wenyumeiae]RKK01368.1 PhzF family phenazine biosynthesis protein [Pseudoroseomonas wenyumeiae]RMI14675.1 PhzF family phenazine biosynthesis isomerase [Pseudoroseomonas wenyumeiae]